jgi:RNA polymerase sigma factor (sigma-70 family)
MDTTSATLLQRVKTAADADAWREFYRLYFPLLTKYGRLRGLRQDAAEEVAQECMESLARRMRRFEYARGRGRFRSYLRKMVENRILSQRRRRPVLQARTGQLERVAARSRPDEDWDRLWLREHLAYCLGRVESRCAADTVQAFRLYALEERPVDEVCRELGLSANQVYVAKARMIRRLRRVVAEMIGDVF